MDGSNLYNLSNSVRNSRSTRERLGSLRANSTSIWRSSGREVFAKSARDEDDEEALMWASLEKLPTFDRLRKGLLLGSHGDDVSETDIDNLGVQPRKRILAKSFHSRQDNTNYYIKGRYNMKALKKERQANTSKKNSQPSGSKIPFP